MKDARVDYSISAYTFCIRRQWRLLLNLIPGIKRMDVVNKSDEGKNALFHRTLKQYFAKICFAVSYILFTHAQYVRVC